MSGVDAGWILAQAARLRRWRLLSLILLGIAAAALGAVTVTRLTGRVPVGAAAALAAALFAVLGALYQVRRRAVGPAEIAGHLNRTVPQAEESAHLLLADPAGLPLLARLQRRRIETGLAGLPAPPPLPDARRRDHLRAAAVLMILTATMAVVPGLHGGGALPTAAEAGAEAGNADGAPAGFRDVAITVTPPAYTGRPPRRTADWHLEAEEGATIRWRVTAAGRVTAGHLLTTAGDSIPLAQAGDGHFEVELRAGRSTLYRLVAETPDGRPAPAPDHRLIIRPDAPPVVTFVAPEPRTAVGPGDPRTLGIEVLATDDYGVDSTVIVATVTKGQGEGVKFREQRFGFSDRLPREPRGLLLRRTLDLDALGLEPGDELYFHVVATDRRAPAPNLTRSETIFVSMLDSARAMAGPGSGVTLDLPPDFFRSQRQLIIDTEKLLADRPRIAALLFRQRANDLGLDQGLLRLRYGQFMGDEYEGQLAGSGREAHADDHGDPDDEPPPQPVIDPITGVAIIDPLADLLHDHDDPENATLLAPQIKAKLRDAISAMWSAELHLRLADPRRSLPFQQRALELLQEIRQDARVYVRRVGFDPPPLEPDRRRLAGDLSEIRLPAQDRSVEAALSHPALRLGLTVVQRLRAGSPLRSGDRAALEAAGQELGRLAVDAPVDLLEPLGALRRAITALTGGPACADCLERAERGLWLALPEASPAVGAPPRGRSSLAERYFRLLDGGR